MHDALSRSARALIAGAGLSALASIGMGCSCGTPAVPLIDAGPRDAQLPDAQGRDAQARVDAGVGITCRIENVEDDLTLLARDDSTSPPPIIRVARGTTDFVVVWSDERDDGRALRYARFPRTASEGAVVPPTSLGASTANGVAPSILSVEGGWLIAWQSGPNVVVQRFDGSFVASGTPTMLGAGTQPVVQRIGTTNLVAWVSGGRIVGRRVGADASASGAQFDLASPSTAPGAIALSTVGTGTSVGVLAWSPPEAAPGAGSNTMVQPLDGTGAPMGAAAMLGSEANADGDIAIAGVVTSADPTVFPLPAATVFDARIAGEFREIRFRLLDEDGQPDFAEGAVNQDGVRSWDPTLIGFLDGYLVGHRALQVGAPDPIIRVAYLDRDGCRLGAALSEFDLVNIAPEGGPIALAELDDEIVLVGWTEVVLDPGFTDYRVARVRCD